MRRWKKEGKPLPDEYPLYLLRVLWRNYRQTGNLCLSSSELTRPLFARLMVFTDKGARDGRFLVSSPELQPLYDAVRLMQQRNWVVRPDNTDLVYLTQDGIGYASKRWVPWYLKLRDFVKGPAKAIAWAALKYLVAPVTVSLLGYWLLKQLG